MSTIVAPKPRQARAIETRRRLLAAARDTLVEHGYHGATTTEVVRRAGLSQGALFRHFPSKAALLAGVLVFVGEDMLSTFLARFQQRGPGGDFVAAGVDAAWSAIERPETSALLEVLLASRTDAALRTLIQPAAMHFYERIYRELNALALPQLQIPAATSLLWLMLDVMHGRFLANLAGRDEAFDRVQKELLVRVVRDEMARAGAGVGSTK